jgi:hypothetical protein
MRVRAAFFLGVILATAVAVSVVRYRKYPSFRAWWDAEGLPIWIVAGLIGGGCYAAL